MWPRTQESGSYTSHCSPGPSSRAELSRDLGRTPRFNPYGLNTVGWKDQRLNQTEWATTPKPKSQTSPGDYQDSHPEPAQELKEEDQRNVFCNANCRFSLEKLPQVFWGWGHQEYPWRNSIPQRNRGEKLGFFQKKVDHLYLLWSYGDKVQKETKDHKGTSHFSLAYCKKIHVE